MAGAAFIAIVYALGLDWFLDAEARHELTTRGIITILGLGLAAMVAVVELKKWFDRMVPGPGPGHAGRGRTVESHFEGFKLSELPYQGPDVPVTFLFKNRQFGEFFARANTKTGGDAGNGGPTGQATGRVTTQWVRPI